ncbi:MAG: DNA polymerase III subunit chi [Burkholderiales bacterium PBB3]|nr:MAG: DNA polymerase III subunit chi [Burkholderiales bacterium PBB3]
MTQVAFHFGAPDKLAYTCRLLRKASSSGAKVVVLAEPATALRLDVDLWGVSPVDFVPHCLSSASASLLRHSTVVLTSELDAAPQSAHAVLVQLCRSAPPHVQSYGRVIEVVGLDEADRAEARQRWRAYAAWGLPIQKHDLALKENT